MRNGGDLDMAAAERLAGRLALIDGFPRSTEAREGTAIQLLRLCPGNDEYSPLEQATVLVDEAIATLDEWQGWRSIRAVFDSLFREQLEFDATAPNSLPAGVCAICSAYGTVFDSSGASVRCRCAYGQRITDAELTYRNQGQSVLERLTRGSAGKPMPVPAPRPKRPGATPRRITEEDVARAVENMREQKERQPA